MTPRSTARLVWWLRLVGVFYLAQAVAMVFARAPVRAFGPDGALDQAEAGEPVAVFLVDTWTTFGLEVAAIGVVLLAASWIPELTSGVAWTVIAVEIVRGVLNDLYFIARGIDVAGYAVWIVIHSVVIVSGLLVLRGASTDRAATARA